MERKFHAEHRAAGSMESCNRHKVIKKFAEFPQNYIYRFLFLFSPETLLLQLAGSLPHTRNQVEEVSLSFGPLTQSTMGSQ